MTKTSARRSTAERIHTAELFCFDSTTNGVKTRSLFSAVSWKNTLIVFRVALSSLQPSKYGLLAGSNERGAL
jgi:hypothetical protein